MKVVITGATGFTGQEVLKQCIEHSSITSIVVLSRRQLPESVADPKVKVVVLDDFLEYSPSTLSELKGADACIWTLGKPYIQDRDEARRVSIDYTMTAANAFTKDTAAREGRFRFVYVSGLAAVRDQTKSLWFMGEYRKIRGQVEYELIEHAKRTPTIFESYILRPGAILDQGYSLRNIAWSLGPSIRVGALARAMIDIALDGFEKDTLENTDVVRGWDAGVRNPQ